MLSNKDLFLTGGSGTLGNAIAKRRKEEGWTGKMTVYSRDPMKQLRMKRKYPDVNYVLGDVRNYEIMKHAMIGHDIILHLAAQKHIPYGEYDSLETMDVNYNGTVLACEAALEVGAEKFMFISTDKVCHSANLYGMSKAAGEKVVQEYARIQDLCDFHIVRYGNVLESTGSVVEIWRNAVARGEKIKITDPEMTRFWLSPSQAVDYVIETFDYPPGIVWIPKMKSLDIGTLARYATNIEDGDWDAIPLRPGEKIHETLLTGEELRHSFEYGDGFALFPSTAEELDPRARSQAPYTSDTAPELTKEELMELLGE